MAELSDMAWVETRKALRSGMPLWTATGAIFLPLAIAFLIFVARNPEVSQNLGMVGAKANLLAYSNMAWPAYLALLTQVVAVGGFFVFVLVASWVFGREFVDGTAKDLLAVPIRRSSMILGKFAVVAVWSAVLALEMSIVGVAMGAIIDLPGGSLGVTLGGGITTAAMACLLIAVTSPFALLASAGRGYLLPIGVAILTVILTNVVVIVGWGEYFPWAVPALYAQARASLPPVSYGIVFLTGLAGMIGTYLWWSLADQNR